jgi:hypothetical protein
MVVAFVVVVAVVMVLTVVVAGGVVGAIRGQGGAGATDRHHDCDGEGRCASLQHLLPPFWTSRSWIAPVALIRVSPGIRGAPGEGSARIRA